jgi:hypothetical protein
VFKAFNTKLEYFSICFISPYLFEYAVATICVFRGGLVKQLTTRTQYTHFSTSLYYTTFRTKQVHTGYSFKLSYVHRQFLALCGGGQITCSLRRVDYRSLMPRRRLEFEQAFWIEIKRFIRDHVLTLDMVSSGFCVNNRSEWNKMERSLVCCVIFK